MNQTLISIFVFGLLLLFIFSPFAALAGLMLLLFVATLFSFVGNILKATFSGEDNEQQHSQ